jgi:hypothetical protein
MGALIMTSTKRPRFQKRRRKLGWQSSGRTRAQRKSNDRSTIVEPTLEPSNHLKKDQIAPDGASSISKTYAFEDGIIRLTEKDFSKWEQAYPQLDLRAELLSLSKWAVEQGPQDWFHAVKGALAKRNRESKERRERPANGTGNPLFEGIT